MEPILTGLAATAVVYGIKKYMDGRKKKSGGGDPASGGGGGVVETGFPTFSPDAQAKAWYLATSAQWTPTGEVGDNAGRIAYTNRGAIKTDSDAQRAANDAWFRNAMAKGFRPVVSDTLVISGASATPPPYLVFVPDGFSRGSLPADWGPLLQLYAPPPGYNNGGPGGIGGVGQQPQQPQQPADPFAEITDKALRAQIKALAESDTVGLLDLDQTAAELDAAGYTASANVLREHRKDLTLRRKIEAQQRGGYLYVVRQNDLPSLVAQHYGGKKIGVISELQKLNPTVSTGGTWSQWFEGTEILLPVKWGDPSLKPLPPLAGGGGQKAGSAGGPGAPPTPGSSPYYPFGQNPDAPTPKNPPKGQAPNVWYGPNGEGPFSGPPPKEKPPFLGGEGGGLGNLQYEGGPTFGGAPNISIEGGPQ